MSAVNATDIPDERKFMTDFWEFRKKFYNPEDANEYWNTLIDASDELSKAYGNPYFTSLILACIDDIEYRYRLTNKPLKSDPVDLVYARICRKRKEEAHT